MNERTEPLFVNLFRSTGIDSQPDGPVQQPYLSYRPAMIHRLAKSNSRNRFLVSLNVYKYGLSNYLIIFSTINSKMAIMMTIDTPDVAYIIRPRLMTFPADLS
jgi:hypothetical protein